MNRFTVDAGTLDADVSAALRQEPITQRQQVLGDRSESFHRLSGFLAGTSDQQARDDRRLMYIEPTASLHNGVHLRLLNGEASAAPLATQETAMRPSRCRVRQEVVPLPARVSLCHGVATTAVEATFTCSPFRGWFCHSLTRVNAQKRSVPTHFHPRWCAFGACYLCDILGPRGAKMSHTSPPMTVCCGGLASGTSAARRKPVGAGRFGGES